ncbi:hypothetical protein METHB2_20106 [Candidatus Methylobacter favarea]|uniref:Uncharacterized protein n=1 Tax=Candidatus Methylobacter favarea TaxID=2707345 RepID=A0A8S0WZM6_9GAMM|nr:hypothetical protein METHB2_20106 [Candidatus Methylobacter favarea]
MITLINDIHLKFRRFNQSKNNKKAAANYPPLFILITN